MCHPERSEGSHTWAEMLRCTQHDKTLLHGCHAEPQRSISTPSTTDLRLRLKVTPVGSNRRAQAVMLSRSEASRRRARSFPHLIVKLHYWPLQLLQPTSNDITMFFVMLIGVASYEAKNWVPTLTPGERTIEGLFTYALHGCQHALI